MALTGSSALGMGAGPRTGAAVEDAAFSWGLAGYGRTQLLEAHAREDEDTMAIDITFDSRTDSNGEDPDFASPTLRRYHRLLWSKPLPTGALVEHPAAEMPTRPDDNGAT